MVDIRAFIKYHKTNLLISILLLIISQYLFLYGIESPIKLYFDETHYIPAARTILSLGHQLNLEHPPLAKILMAFGIKIFGDTPLGWRFMSTLFGSLTLVSFFWIGLSLFRSRSTALFIALLSLCNGLLFVQSRIAMLDTFMFTFISIGLIPFINIFTKEKTEQGTNISLIFTGICMGLATSSKWVGLVAIVLTVFIAIFIKLLNSKKRSSLPMQKLTYKKITISLLVVPLITYFLITFSHYWLISANKSFVGYFVSQENMWKMLKSVQANHSYGSHWWQWPFLHRPMWYFFERTAYSAGKLSHGIILIGNPLIMWAGMLCFPYTCWRFIKIRSLTTLFPLTLYLAFLLCWAVAPRKLSFYYYYYPSGMFLTLSIAYIYHTYAMKNTLTKTMAAIFTLAASGLMFYFYPVLSNMNFYSPYLKRWMWFSSWI